MRAPWMNEIERLWPEYAGVIHRFGARRRESSAAPRTTDASPSTLAPMKDELEFLEDLCLSLLREIDPDQDQAYGPPEAGGM